MKSDIRTSIFTSAASEIAHRIGQDHVPHGLVVFDVASAAAEVAVQRLGDGLLEIGARDRRLRQALEQDLALVEKAGRAIAALKGEVGDKGLLQGESSPSLAWPSTVRIDLPSKLAAGTMQVGLV